MRCDFKEIANKLNQLNSIKHMMISEFTERTGITPTEREYAAIEEMYYNFPGDKDEFCARWCKMNKERVKAANEERKAQEQRRKVSDRLWSMIAKVDRWHSKNGYSIADEPLSLDFFNKTEWSVLDKVGITKWMYTEEEAYHYGYVLPSGLIVAPHARISDTQLKIKKYLKIA